MTDGLSAADVALLSGNGRNNDGAFGGNGGWLWFVVVLAVLFGWGGNGFGGGFGGGGAGVQGALTRGDLCMDMNFQEVKREVQNTNDAVNLGFANLNSTICNQQYDTARMIDGLGTTIQGGFNAANIVALQGQNAIQTQLAQCCCENREGQAQIRYDMATNTCALQNTIQTGFRDSIEATQAGTRAILDYLCQEKISDLQSENSALRLSASQAAQNSYLISQLRPTPIPSWNVPNPYAYTGVGYGYGYGNGCGCAC